MSTIKNRDLKSAIASLAEIGKTALPIPLAVRMAKLRHNLEAHGRAVDEASVGAFLAASGGQPEVKDNSPEHREFQEKLKELMDAEYELPDSFTLYQRVNGEAPEYAWSENFKTGKLKEIAPNVFYGLLPFTEIVDVEEDADE